MPQDFVVGQVLTAAQMDTLSGAVDGYATTATAAGTTTLTVASLYQQFFTGSTTQTVTMPVASTLYVGWKVRIVNNSSGVVTIQSSGANSIYAAPAGADVIVTCILASGTTAASWDYKNATAAAAAGGKVLQVVNATYGTETSTTSSSYVDTGLSLAITPTLNTSKILVLISQHLTAAGTSGDGVLGFTALRGGTTLFANTYGVIFNMGSTNLGGGNWGFTYLDSPATTSATTYKTQFKRVSASGTQYAQFGAAQSTITLLEIGA